jgi:hypothetical protein
MIPKDITKRRVILARLSSNPPARSKIPLFVAIENFLVRTQASARIN